MSMVAIFKLACCEKEIVFGRVRGSSKYPPAVNKCQFGCKPKLAPNGAPEKFGLVFSRYQGEEFLSDELRKTWRFSPKDIVSKKKKQEDVLF